MTGGVIVCPRRSVWWLWIGFRIGLSNLELAGEGEDIIGVEVGTTLALAPGRGHRGGVWRQ